MRLFFGSIFVSFVAVTAPLNAASVSVIDPSDFPVAGSSTVETVGVRFRGGQQPEIDIETRTRTVDLQQNQNGFGLNLDYQQTLAEFELRLPTIGALRLTDRLLFSDGQLLADGEPFPDTSEEVFLDGPPETDPSDPTLFRIDQPHAFTYTTPGGSGGPFFAADTAFFAVTASGETENIFITESGGGTLETLRLTAGNRSVSLGGEVIDESRIDAALPDLPGGTPLIDSLEFIDGDFVATGVLPAGSYGITLSGRGGTDLDDGSGGSFASARLTGVALPTAVPSPRAFSLAMAVPPMLFVRRRRQSGAG